MPMRRCAACGAKLEKKELVRFTASGAKVETDLNFPQKGGRQGRGAYLCRKRECFDAAFKKGGAVFSRLLRANVAAAPVDEFWKLVIK